MATKLAKIAADFSTQLAAKMLVGATTGTLQSVTDDDGVALTNGVYYFTIDGNNSNKEYLQVTITGTAMASVKNVTRQGVITSGTVREHRAGALVELTDFANLKFLTNLLTGTDDLDATTPLEYDAAPTLTPGTNQLATVAYADAIAAAGGPNASTTVQGLVEEATTAEIDAGTATGGTGAKLFAPLDKLALSIYGTRLPSANEKIAITSLAAGVLPYAADAGSDDTYVVTLSPVPASYTAGMTVRFKANTANTGAATLNVNGLGAKTIVKSKDLTLHTGDIKAGQIVDVIYDGTNFQLLSPVTNVYKATVTTYDLSSASGNQTIAHGLGAIPNRIKLTGLNGVGTEHHSHSEGTYDGTSTTCIYLSAGSALAPVTGNSTTFIIKLYSGTNWSTAYQSATVTMDATNVTLAWTSNGNSVSGTAQLLLEAWG